MQRRLWQPEESGAGEVAVGGVEFKPAQVSETVERFTPGPYGSTQLRATIFPAVKE